MSEERETVEGRRAVKDDKSETIGSTRMRLSEIQLYRFVYDYQ